MLLLAKTDLTGLTAHSTQEGKLAFKSQGVRVEHSQLQCTGQSSQHCQVYAQCHVMGLAKIDRMLQEESTWDSPLGEHTPSIYKPVN